jgi:hypothetical protein
MTLQEILKPYKDHCRYLKNAKLNTITQKNSTNVFVAEGQFSIPQSCYISFTNHFNSVEFNICFNQLAYFLLYECIKHQHLSQLRNWTVDDFFRNQLNTMLILKFESEFPKMITASNFNGFLEITNSRLRIWNCFVCYS